MAQDQFISSDKTTETTNRDNTVLYRGRMSLITSTQGPSSIYAPYYYASHTLDLSFLDTQGLFPKVEVWAKTGTTGNRVFTQAPYAFTDVGTLDVATYTKVDLLENVFISKTEGYTLGLRISLFHKTQNTTIEFYYTVTTLAVGHADIDLYPNDGTFSA